MGGSSFAAMTFAATVYVVFRRCVNNSGVFFSLFPSFFKVRIKTLLPSRVPVLPAKVLPSADLPSPPEPPVAAAFSMLSPLLHQNPNRPLRRHFRLRPKPATTITAATTATT